MATTDPNLTSFSNTPQAKDDLFLDVTTEASLEAGGTITLNVTANDLGGAAKTLYSVDEGSGTTSQILKDLAASDLTNGTMFDAQTARGANLQIVDGKVQVSFTADYLKGLDALGEGQSFTDSFVYAIRLANGTLSWAKVTFSIAGTNDAAVVTGVSEAPLTETDAVQSVGGKLTATDVDSSADFQVQTAVAGSNGYGKFSIAADGTWTYAMDSAHDEFQAGVDYTDSITVKTADGTSQVLTVTMHGTNDAAQITGSSTASLTESNEQQSTGGSLSATDVDSSADFQVQTAVAGSNGYGKFSIAADGTWMYAMDSAHDEFRAGVDYTDSITVQTADGTSQLLTVTMHGSNDAPQAPTVPASAGAGTEDAAFVVSASELLQGFTDVDSDTLGIAGLVVSDATVHDNGDGTYSITPNANFNGTLTLSYDVVDGDGGQAAGSRDYVIANVEDEATADLAVAGKAIGGGTLVASLTNVVDPDGSTTTTYEWQQNIGGEWTAIAGATDATLSIPAGASYLTQDLRVVATTHDPYGGTTEFTKVVEHVVSAAVDDLLYVSISTTARFGFDVLLANDAKPAGVDIENITVVSAGNISSAVMLDKTARVFSFATGQLSSDATLEYTLTDGSKASVAVQTIQVSGKGDTVALSGTYAGSYIALQPGADTASGSGTAYDTFLGDKDNDRLTGGGGHDTFVFNTTLNTAGVDTITDFDADNASAGHDLMQLSAAVFKDLSAAAGSLSSSGFVAYSAATYAATGTNAKVVYDQATGNVYYDANGSTGGLGDAVQFAVLANKPTGVDASDFTIL